METGLVDDSNKKMEEKNTYLQNKIIELILSIKVSQVINEEGGFQYHYR